MDQIILASSSVYRHELFSRLKIPFSTFSTDIDESQREGEPIPELVIRLSKEKAQAALLKHPEAICIGSDEVAAVGGQILGKPGNHENAVKQLMLMSGKKVIFYTGVCVIAKAHLDYHLSMTTVKLRSLTHQMIENYLLKEKPYESAGSFKSETLGSALLTEFVSDDPTAIIGLPLIKLCDMLLAVGVEVI